MDLSSSKIPSRPPFLGRQLHLELYDCPHSTLDDQQWIESALLACASAIKATVVQSTFHKLSPQGVSGVVVIMESHIAIHTWPEYGYAAVDIFTCGDMDMAPGVAVVTQLLGAQRTEENIFLRGSVSASLDGRISTSLDRRISD